MYQLTRKYLASTISCLLLLLTISVHAEQDQRNTVRTLQRNVAMTLAEQGFEAYRELFHPDYENWANGGRLLKRKEFLDAVKTWFEAGNRAISTTMQSVSTEIFGDIALSRYTLREDFNNDESFVGYFTSVSKKEKGQWKLFRTSFTVLYRGATDALPKEFEIQEYKGF
ncbi:MAG: nuclear transport factor 2 family protein [Marinicella sp.]|nr:nuclear transport factor 2 family protein [Xanthomonadales bacterium]